MALRGENGYEVADHGRFALVVQRDDFLVRQLVQRHFHHRYRTVDDLRARRDDRFRLLATQHHLRDFRRVGEVHQPRLFDDDAGFFQPLLQFDDQRSRNDVGAGEQRGLGRPAERDIAMVVGEGTREMTHGGFTLQLDVVFIAVDVEAGLGRVVYAPNDDCGDFDRVAAFVVDLEALTV